MNIILETDRLILRRVSLRDKHELFALHSDPEVQKYTGEPVVTSIKEIEESVSGRLQDYQTYGYGRLAVIDKINNEFIGWAGLAYLPEFDVTDLGYRLKKKYWGMGYATEASLAIIDYGFNELKLDKIVAIAMPENTASFNIMKKVGMTYLKHAPYEEGSEDGIWYQILKSTYDMDSSDNLN